METKNWNDLVEKIERLKHAKAIDLSMEEDLSIAVMNLVSLEEHFYFTAQKLGKDEYLNLLREVRETRKKMMEKLVPKDAHEGETWCITKHLLATTMRLIEVGTKLRADGKTEEAKEVFDHGWKMYSLFWALRLKLVDVSGLRHVASGEKPWTLQEIVNKLVDCCDE